MRNNKKEFRKSGIMYLLPELRWIFLADNNIMIQLRYILIFKTINDTVFLLKKEKNNNRIYIFLMLVVEQTKKHTQVVF